MILTNYSSLRGFTLLETLASVAILTVVVIGPLSAIVTSSAYAHQTKDTMIATYLAEESAELLQNQYDSISVLCQKNSTDPLCAQEIGEATIGQTSWRVFKERFDSPVSPSENKASCYLTKLDGTTGNPSGCTFDYANVALATNTDPIRYAGDSEKCSALREVTKTVTTYTYGGATINFDQYQSLLNSGGEQGVTNPNIKATETKRKMFVCGGVEDRVSGGTVAKSFSRNITIEPMTTFEPGAHSGQFNDDLRVISNVSYKAVNGATKTVKLVRFIHSRK